MKRKGMLFIALAALITAAPAAGMDPVERGNELFNNARLGMSGKGCATCHPNGSNLDSFCSDEEQLVKSINHCIKKAPTGKPLPAESADMKAILMYMRTFAYPWGSELE